MLTRWFRPTDALLNVGSGAGRASFALWELGYERVLGIEHDRALVAEARSLAARLEYATPFRVGEVTRLALPEGAYDGAFWLESSLAACEQPERAATLRALRRSISRDGRLLLTTPCEWASDEVRALLASAGWQDEESVRRDANDSEAPEVRLAYPDCQFWVARAG